jgi:hypothetical protein
MDDFLGFRIGACAVMALWIGAVVARDLIKGDSGVSTSVGGPLQFAVTDNPVGYLSLVLMKAAIAVFFAWIGLHLAGLAPDPIQLARGLLTLR